MVALRSEELAGEREPARLEARGLFGRLVDMRVDPLGVFLEGLERGDVVRTRLAALPAIFVYDPELIYQVLVERVALYRKQTRGYKKLRLLLGDGLVTSEGSFWLRQRRIAQPAFHKERIAAFADVMAASADEAARALEGRAVRNEVVDMHDEMMRLTLRIAGLTLLSRDLSGEAREVGEALSAVLERFHWLVTAPLPFPEYWPFPENVRLHRSIARLNRVVGALIEERRRTGEDKGDLLSMWMHIRDEETGEQMNDQQLRDEVMTMFLAGHETTAVALSWTLHLLSRHPEIAERAQREVDEVLEGRMPSAQDASRLVYTGQVLDEAMRLYPPVWALARRPDEDDVLGGVRIEVVTATPPAR